MGRAPSSQGMIGTVRWCWWTSPHADDRQLSGRTENNRVVNFDGPPGLIGPLCRSRHITPRRCPIPCAAGCKPVREPPVATLRTSQLADIRAARALNLNTAPNFGIYCWNPSTTRVWPIYVGIWTSTCARSNAGWA